MEEERESAATRQDASDCSFLTRPAGTHERHSRSDIRDKRHVDELGMREEILPLRREDRDMEGVVKRVREAERVPRLQTNARRGQLSLREIRLFFVSRLTSSCSSNSTHHHPFSPVPSAFLSPQIPFTAPALLGSRTIHRTSSSWVIPAGRPKTLTIRERDWRKASIPEEKVPEEKEAGEGEGEGGAGDLSQVRWRRSSICDEREEEQEGRDGMKGETHVSERVECVQSGEIEGEVKGRAAARER